MSFFDFLKSKPAQATPVRPTSDNWQNSQTGYGTSRDKAAYGEFFWNSILDHNQLLALYMGDDIAAKIVDFRPREMLRRGFTVTFGETKPAEKLCKYSERLKAKDRIKETMTWARLYGGCLLVMGIEDGQTMDKPLNEKAIRTVRYLNVIDRRYASPHKYYTNPLEPNLGDVEVYTLNGQLVHESRVIRFDGHRADRSTEQAYLGGWGISVLQRPYDVVRQFATTYQATTSLMADASQAVFKIKGLMEMIALDPDSLATRMRMVDMARSSARALLLDADGEEFNRVPTSFAGIPEVLDRFQQRLSAAVDIPVSVLMGRSAAGMNSTGDNEIRALYDQMASDQENELKPRLERLFSVLASAKDSGAEGPPEDVDIDFAPLWQPTEKEQAEIEKLVGERDTAYETAGILTAEEIAISRFGKGKFSAETTIKVDVRQKALDDESAFEEPEPPPVVVATPDPDAPPPEKPAPDAPPNG